MNRSLAIRATLCCAALGACNTGLTPDWKLNDFRIMGFQSVPAQPARGESAQLTLAYADPLARPVQVVWLACSNPVSVTAGGDAGVDSGSGFGGSSGCVPAIAPDLGNVTTIHVPAAGGAINDTNNEVVNIIGYACAGGTIGPPMDGGTLLSCTANGSGPARGWQFIGEVRVQSPDAVNPPNNNPEIAEVDFGLMDGSIGPITADAPPGVPHCEGTSGSTTCPLWQFRVLFTPTSREPYLGPGGADAGPIMQQEQLTVGYLIDLGTLTGGQRSDSYADPMSNMANNWTPPNAAGTAHVYFFAIDGRGGFTWTTRTVTVQ